jgi:hypothetical protein
MSSLARALPLVLALAAAGPAAAAETPPGPGPAPASEPAPAGRLLAPDAAWRGARWGMAVDAVLAAVPGARRLEPPVRLADGRVVEAELSPVALGGLEFRAHFVFQDGKLARVSLKNLPSSRAAGKDFDALRARLAGEAGQPGEERPRATSIDLREIRFTRGGTAVDLKFLEGAVVLLYHPAPAPAARPPD